MSSYYSYHSYLPGCEVTKVPEGSVTRCTSRICRLGWSRRALVCNNRTNMSRPLVCHCQRVCKISGTLQVLVSDVIRSTCNACPSDVNFFTFCTMVITEIRILIKRDCTRGCGGISLFCSLTASVYRESHICFGHLFSPLLSQCLLLPPPPKQN